MIYSEADYLRTMQRLAAIEESILVERREESLDNQATLSALHFAAITVRSDLLNYDADVNRDRLGTWKYLHSGRRFWFESPTKDDFDIEDIAQGLSNTCRFGGHVTDFYSVAQHSVLASSLVDQDYALFALLHDAGEAFLGDIISPLKKMLPEYEPLEERVMVCVADKFGFTMEPVARKTVKTADLICLATEFRDVTRTRVCRIPFTQLPLSETIKPWSPKKAKRLFLRRFHELVG